MKKLILLLSFFLISFIGVGQISIISLPYNPSTTNFNSYNPSSAANLTSTIPNGWSASCTGTAAYNGQGTGTGATGGYWSYGSSSEFSIGALRSGTPGNITYTVSFVNNSGATITDITIQWDYEQWRYVNTSGWDCSGTGSLSGNSTLNGKDFTGSSSGTNGTCTTTSISSFNLTGLSISNGSSFGISWVTTDATGSDNGVSIDNFLISASGLTPTLTVSPSTLSGFIYDYGNGPSTSQSYTLSGTNLTGFPDNIVVTAPTDYEISTDDITFSNTINVPYSSATLSSTTIYVRLKAGLSTGTYNGEIITNAGGGATTVNVTCNGQVNALSSCGLEEFNNYNGGTRPAGWTFTSIPSGDVYTTSGNYGTSSPSLQMNATGDVVETTTYSNVTELSFWIKGQGTNNQSSLLVEGWNGSSWSTIELIKPLPTTATIYTYTTVSAYTKFRFTYDKGAGNLAFDDVNVTCNAYSNTITTGTVSTTPFTISCASGTSGTVAFTSTDIFTSNTYTAQLSNSSGSFTTPLNIGTLVSDANSGTINITIPAGLTTGSGYKIRVISSNPPIIGSSSSTFTITCTDGPCTNSYFEIQSILVDACEDSTGWEGENEMFRFIVGSTSLNTSDITVSWPNNPWKGLCQNATTASIISAINATITGGGQLIEPTGGVLPAGAQVMFFTNTQFSYELFDFSTLNYTLYAIFQCEDNHPGHFVNYSSTSKLRTLTLNFDGFGSDMVTYDAHLIYNGNGATVDFDPPGNPTYSPNGTCNTVPIFPLPITLLYFGYKCYSDYINFEWSTASEINNDYFDIEYSIDGYDYSSVSRVEGAGNSNNQLFYEQSVYNTTGYYRLKQTDYDGKYSYSDPIYVNCQNTDITIYPNPFNKEIVIHLPDNTEVNANIYDGIGNIIKSEISNNTIIFDMRNYENGIYFLTINGETINLVYKLIKN